MSFADVKVLDLLPERGYFAAGYVAGSARAWALRVLEGTWKCFRRTSWQNETKKASWQNETKKLQKKQRTAVYLTARLTSSTTEAGAFTISVTSCASPSPAIG